MESHKYREACSLPFKYLGEKFPALQISVLVTRNLPDLAGTLSVSVSLLHVIVPPLMGLIIVTVVLMKEPLVKVICATTDEVFSVQVSVVPTS